VEIGLRTDFMRKLIRFWREHLHDGSLTLVEDLRGLVPLWSVMAFAAYASHVLRSLICVRQSVVSA